MVDLNFLIDDLGTSQSYKQIIDIQGNGLTTNSKDFLIILDLILPDSLPYQINIVNFIKKKRKLYLDFSSFILNITDVDLLFSPKTLKINFLDDKEYIFASYCSPIKIF